MRPAPPRPSAAERRRQHGGGLDYFEDDQGNRVYGAEARERGDAMIVQQQREHEAAVRRLRQHLRTRTLSPARPTRSPTGRSASRMRAVTRSYSRSGDSGDDGGDSDDGPSDRPAVAEALEREYRPLDQCHRAVLAVSDRRGA